MLGMLAARSSADNGAPVDAHDTGCLPECSRRGHPANAGCPPQCWKVFFSAGVVSAAVLRKDVSMLLMLLAVCHSAGKWSSPLVLMMLAVCRSA